MTRCSMTGRTFLPVPIDIGAVKALRQVHIHLDRTALPYTSQAVLDVEIQLRSIERAVARIDAECPCRPRRRHRPALFHTDPRPRSLPCKSSGRVDSSMSYVRPKTEYMRSMKRIRRFDLILHLVRTHEQMRIILCKGADAEQPVQRTARLMAMDLSQLSHTQRQILVGMQTRCYRRASLPDSSSA